MKRLSVEVSEAKSLSIVEYKELDAYKLDLEETASLFLMKERVKLQRLLRRLHQIEDMSILEKVEEEFMLSEDDEVKGDSQGSQPPI